MKQTKMQNGFYIVRPKCKNGYFSYRLFLVEYKEGWVEPFQDMEMEYVCKRPLTNEEYKILDSLILQLEGMPKEPEFEIIIKPSVFINVDKHIEITVFAFAKMIDSE